MAGRVACDPAVELLLRDAPGPWIMPATPVTAEIQQWGRTEPRRALYRHAFRAPLRAGEAGPVRLRLRALREAEVRLNGERVRLEPAGRAAGGWKRGLRAEISGELRPGRNRLEVTVRNALGPPLLALRLEGAGLDVATGPGWTVSVDGGRPQRARPANDVRPHPGSFGAESPAGALAHHRGGLALLALVSVAAFLALRRRREPWARAGLPWVVAGLVALAWLALLVTRFAAVDLRTGFDAMGHLAYVKVLAEQGRLPLATEGWSTYHPPLFYAASALLGGVGAWAGPTGSEWALKLLPFLSGLGLVALALALARSLLPGQPVAAALATLFAGVLPVNLYTAAYFTNEGLHALLGGAALVVAVRLLRDRDPGPRRLAGLSALLGLALLAKFTALVVAALAGGFAGAAALAERRGGARARAARVAALVLPALAVAGWYYARNVALLGTPFLGNWELSAPGRSWWSQPGFHTPDYYLSFGAALRHPWFSGFASFWDSLYSTLWGDGFLGGRAEVGARHPHWSYGWMAAGYLLALPATALLLVGWVRSAWSALRDADGGRRAAWGLVALTPPAFGFAVLYTTLELPYFGQAKAAYALATVPVLGLHFALGATACDAWLARRGGLPLRVLGAAWLGSFAGTLYLGFAG